MAARLATLAGLLALLTPGMAQQNETEPEEPVVEDWVECVCGQSGGIDSLLAFLALDSGCHAIRCADHGIEGNVAVVDHPTLSILEVGDNRVKQLNISGNFNLTEVHARSNQIAALNVFDAPTLKVLDLGVNKVETWDLSGATNLAVLHLPASGLTTVPSEVLALPRLEHLTLQNNQLETVDLSSLTTLKTLRVDRNKLASLDLRPNTGLVNVRAELNRGLSTMQVASQTLRTIYAKECSLTTVGLDKAPALEVLDLASNNLATLDVTKCPDMRVLKLFNNFLTTLDLSKQGPALTELNLQGNLLADIGDIKHLTGLKVLKLENNCLSEVCAANETELGCIKPYVEAACEREETVSGAAGVRAATAAAATLASALAVMRMF